MTSSDSEPCYSWPLVQPFIRVLSEHEGVSAPNIAAIASLPPGMRLPVRLILSWLDAAVLTTGDGDLGLLAAEHVGPGTLEVIGYVTRSAATWGQAIELLLRYIRLMNDAADFTLQARGGRAFITLHSAVPLNRAAADFQSAAVVRLARGSLGSLESFAASFTHAQPSDMRAYRRVFGSAELQFDAVNDTVSFDRALLEAPMTSADPSLNAVLRAHAEHLIAVQPNLDRWSGRVRGALIDLLPAGDANSDYVAARLGVSRRTLVRHLQREGVAYKDLLEQARRELAYQYLAAPTPSVEEIALMLGYSDKSAFSRAFRRWSGQPPQRFRRSRRS